MLDLKVPSTDGRRLHGVAIYGIFAMHASPDQEPSGAVGASILLTKGGRLLHKMDVVQGRHYSDATDLQPVYRLNGDSTMVETVGSVTVEDLELRVDRLWFEIPGGIDADALVFRDRGTPASFVIFDVCFEFIEVLTCPFKGHGGHVALNEVASILRMRDRGRLDEAIHQLCVGLRACADDLDEARGLSLTFLAAVVSSMLEMGGGRNLHKSLLDFARKLETETEIEAIVVIAVREIHSLTDVLVGRLSAVNDPLIDQALKIVARNFARNINDENIATELSLSTSHFRHLFRQVTKQPFHRYMVNLRLEKARELLLQSDSPVGSIAGAVGFQSPAHFSRAFVKRFGVSPSATRDSRR